jgi:transcriptional regulator with XRE-family HTH domain
MTSATGPERGTGDLGAILRHWRAARGMSQLDLSLDAGVSQRHFSFVESGRSRASRRLLITVAEVLNIPLRERNALLLAGGFAPSYPEGDWTETEMAGVNAALQRVLRQHDPFPAVVMDRYWNVKMANEAAPRFFGAFIDMAARRGPRNILHLMFDPEGMRPFIHDWPMVAAALIARARRETVGQVVDTQTRDLIADLAAYPGVDPQWGRAEPLTSHLPIIPLGFVRDGVVLNYFSLVSTIGTPQTVLTQELRIECMFPADEVTEARHIALMGDAT